MESRAIHQEQFMGASVSTPLAWVAKSVIVGMAAGMAMAAALSLRLGGPSEADVRRIFGLLERAGLPVAAPGMSPQRFVELMSVDKKVAAGRMRFVVLERLGSAAIRSDVPAGVLDQTLASTARA